MDAMQIVPNPLNARNYTEINRALGLINRAELELERAERAGYPVDEAKATLKYYRELFDRTKAEYFADKH